MLKCLCWVINCLVSLCVLWVVSVRPFKTMLSDADAGRQVKQMVDFIKLEAKEKATEIRAKVKH